MIGLLRRRNFGLLWFGGLISIAGDWVLYAALPYFVYQRTGSTIATAGMIAAELTPGVVLGTVAGVFVDRWDRRRVLVVSNLLQAASVALLLLVPDGGWIGFVYVAAVVQASVAAFAVPAESALLPTLVEDRDLVPANALNALNNRLGRLIGLPVGGTLLAWAGLRGVVIADCVTFLAAAGLVALITARRPARVGPEPDPTDEARSALATFWHEWVGGIRIMRDDRTIAVLFVVFGLMTFGGTMLDPLYVAWVRDALHRGPQVYALLLTAHSVAGIVGSLAVGAWGARFMPRVLVGWTSFVAGAALIVKFDVPTVELAFALSLLGGATSVVSSVSIETLAQRTVHEDFRGRVFAALGASGALFSLAGAVVGGVAARAVGVTAMLNVAAGLVILAGAVVLRALRDD
jgi:MFS family permease